MPRLEKKTYQANRQQNTNDEELHNGLKLEM